MKRQLLAVAMGAMLAAAAANRVRPDDEAFDYPVPPPRRDGPPDVQVTPWCGQSGKQKAQWKSERPRRR